MKLLFILALSLFLAACSSEKSVTINYNLEESVKVEVTAISYYTTLEGEHEQVGTVARLYFTNEYSQKGDMFYMNRTFVGDRSEGYLKKSYPGELAYRTPNLEIIAQGQKVTDIIGYEDFDSAVVAKITIPDRWKRQISQMTRQIDLDRIERRRWEITRLLSGEVPLNTNVTNMLKLPMIPNAQIDSVLTKGIRRIDGKKCIEYIVYLQEKEPFPYFIWEQHISTVNSGKPFKNYRPKEAVYENRYEVALNLANGIPCREYEYKYGTHGMQNPETGDSVTFKSQISHERFYKLIEP